METKRLEWMAYEIYRRGAADVRAILEGKASVVSFEGAGMTAGESDEWYNWLRETRDALATPTPEADDAD